MISFARGVPAPECLAVEELADCARAAVERDGRTILSYGPGGGYGPLREWLAERHGVESGRVVITSGSLQGFVFLAEQLVGPGARVLVEAPTYDRPLKILTRFGAEIVTVPMDDEGLIPEALGQAITALASRGQRVKFLYTVPSFHNPGGVTLPAARRAQVLDICQRAGLLVIEANPSGLLGFDGEPLRALRADDPDGVIYLGTFSKTIAPGLRVGWALAPPGIRDKLVLAAEAAVLCHSSLAQLMVREYLTSQPWQEQVKVFRELYRERRDAMLDALAAVMPAGCRWTRPAGGFYVWLQLPAGLNAKAMLPRAISSRVAYVPGTGFFTGGAGREFLRLSYCFPEPARIREGVRRLADVVVAETELHSTFRGLLPPLPGPPGGPDFLTGPAGADISR